MQEVLAKVYRWQQHKPDRTISVAFLRRVAKNAWTDHCRKQRNSGSNEVFDEELHLFSPAAGDEMMVREALEQLADRLNPRQMVLILVMDVFQFSASETAELLKTTVGAIKEGLKRARHRLRALVAESAKRDPSGKSKLQPGAGTPREVFEQFLAAFRVGDPVVICRAYSALAAAGLQIVKVTDSAGIYAFTLRDPNGHLIGIFSKNAEAPVSI